MRRRTCQQEQPLHAETINDLARLSGYSLHPVSFVNDYRFKRNALEQPSVPEHYFI